MSIQKIIEGCLLGDGSLEKQATNASFHYTSSSKEHAAYVHSFFKPYCTPTYQSLKRYEFYDSRTEKTYVRYWFRTKCLPIFTEQHNRFYQNRTKIVPTDLVIDKSVLLFWYIGDGELESNYGYVKLHTNCFSQQEVESLCVKLARFESKPLRKQVGEYIVTIPRRRVSDFLTTIGPCIIQDYAHKWKCVPYKNKNIESHGVSDYSSLYTDIEKDFLSGGITIYGLHKKYSVPIKCIKHHFDARLIDWKPIKLSKSIIQETLDGTAIQSWSSGRSASKALGFNASGISECCRGVRLSYKGYRWKFLPSPSIS